MSNAGNQSVKYDRIGNITYKSNVGTYTYDSARPHAVASIDTSTATDLVSSNIFNPAGGYQYDANGNIEVGGSRTIDWTSFNKPSEIDGATGVGRPIERPGRGR